MVTRLVVVLQELCNGQRVCTAVADVSSFGDPCPALGSYLWVEYHCKDRESCFILIHVIVQCGKNNFCECLETSDSLSAMDNKKNSNKKINKW